MRNLDLVQKEEPRENVGGIPVSDTTPPQVNPVALPTSDAALVAFSGSTSDESTSQKAPSMIQTPGIVFAPEGGTPERTATPDPESETKHLVPKLPAAHMVNLYNDGAPCRASRSQSWVTFDAIQRPPRCHLRRHRHQQIVTLGPRRLRNLPRRVSRVSHIRIRLKRTSPLSVPLCCNGQQQQQQQWCLPSHPLSRASGASLPPSLLCVYFYFMTRDWLGYTPGYPGAYPHPYPMTYPHPHSGYGFGHGYRTS